MEPEGKRGVGGAGGGEGHTPRDGLEGPSGPEISVLTKIFSAFISPLRRVSAELTKDSTILSQLFTLLQIARPQNN